MQKRHLFMRSARIAFLTLMGLLGTGQVSIPQSPSAVSTYTNPVIDRDMPDPGALFDQGVFWMTHTTGRLPACPLLSSPDLIHWTYQNSLLTPENAPAWVRNRFWAPELHRIHGRYVLIFTAADTTGTLCIGIATASAITGPYTVRPDPIVREQGIGVIDPNLFEDTDGRVYLFWKTDGNAKRQPCQLLVREMLPDCSAFAAHSSPKVLLTSQADGWENGIIEAPWMLKRGHWYYLVYSGNRYASNYAEGVARSRRITGGFVRYAGNPILRGNDVWSNPGHGTFVQDAHGTDWHLYHAYHRDAPAKGRVQLLDRVDWDRDKGWPNFGNNGSPSILPQPLGLP